jgi:hypothetical protein
VSGASTLAGLTATSVVDSGALAANTLTATGAATLQSTLAVSGASTLAGLTATSVVDSGALTANTLTATGAATLNGATTMASATASGVVTLTNATDATALGTGALVLSTGGAAVGGQLRVGGNITASGTFTQGSVSLASGVIKTSANTDATTTNSGSIISLGGISASKRIVSGGGLADASLSSTSWSAAGSLTIGNNTLTTVNANTSTIASFTVTMPASPAAGQLAIIATSGTVTAMTVSPNSGQTIQGAPSGSAMNANTAEIYVLSGTVWIRVL